MIETCDLKDNRLLSTLALHVTHGTFEFKRAQRVFALFVCCTFSEAFSSCRSVAFASCKHLLSTSSKIHLGHVPSV